MPDRSITSISLNEVRKLIDEKNLGEDITDAVSHLLGLVLALSPVVGGPAALPLLTLIEPKNELIDVLKSAARKISRSKPEDYLDRAERIAAANCLLVYVAFFDALRQQWPSIVRNLGLSEEQGKSRLTSALERVQSPSFDDRSVAAFAVTIPHPADYGLQKDKEGIFAELAAQVIHTLTNVSVRSSRKSGDARSKSLVELELINRAEAFYQAEYLGMAVEFQQFFIWSILQDRATNTGQLRQLADDQRIWFELIGRAMHSLDLGMQGLAEAIARLPHPALVGTVEPNVQAVAEGLHRTYADILQQQVIDEQFTVDDAGHRLAFPKKIDGFIPQAYRLAKYDSESAHLERADSWNERTVQGDIGAFILRYLESPYSVQTPLLILGLPGSGKSLLTEVLAGHLAYPTYTTVRIKLRDVDPNVGFLTQLENQMHADTGGRFITWADFAEGLSMSPPVVILDGYDELLQATGKVYASYLDEIRQFQHQQAVQRRPVRVIVTSRLTLIDKVVIPLGTTVVKLEEFNQERRDSWCRVWNSQNEAYFQQKQLRPFAVPASERLLELAKQPLLLLMLAIYDSLGNELSVQPDIDQTLLYYRLLRRFIERELSKGRAGREFAALAGTDREKAINREMDRLGVAAIGMFNRQDVKIRREDLNADLRYFGLEKSTRAEGRALAEADLLLGSFFFIHESRSKLQNEPMSLGGGSAAFEFLHNTFGEFLAADFILGRAVEEAQTICELTGNTTLEGARAQHLIMLSEGWFGCLLHTALHTRPVILGMIKEWSKHRLGDHQWLLADVLTALDTIVATQLNFVLNDMAIPEPDSKRRALAPYAHLPKRGSLAVYSLNLVLLRAYLEDTVYVLDESVLGSLGTACMPWDSIVNLWRSWFSLNSLGALALTITATRRERQIEIVPGSILGPARISPLHDFYNASSALGDSLTAASVGLHIAPLTRMPQEFIKNLWDRMGGAVPELDAVADMLALKMYAANGDALPGDFGMRISPTSPSVGVDFHDVVARMVHTPQQWLRLAVEEVTLEDLQSLSRYQAEAVVAAQVKLQPSWLPTLLSSFQSKEVWEAFLRAPAAAPVLRAAIQEFDSAQARVAVAAAMHEVRGSTIKAIDVDTASALAVLGYLGGNHYFCVRILDTIIQKCERGGWLLLDIPIGTWEGLANLLRLNELSIAERRDKFVGLLEVATAESVDSSSRDGMSVRMMMPFWVQALRIGAVRELARILDAIDKSLPENPTEIAGWERKSILSLIGWAREVDDPSLMIPVLTGAADWAERFLGPESYAGNAEAIDNPIVARLLTHKEAQDLRWARDALRMEGH